MYFKQYGSIIIIILLQYHEDLKYKIMFQQYCMFRLLLTPHHTIGSRLRLGSHNPQYSKCIVHTITCCYKAAKIKYACEQNNIVIWWCQGANVANQC